MARKNRKKKTRTQRMSGGSMLSSPKKQGYAEGGEPALLAETIAYMKAQEMLASSASTDRDRAMARSTLDSLQSEQMGGTVHPDIHAQMMQEVNAQKAQKKPTPDKSVKKAEGGSMLSPSERKTYQDGGRAYVEDKDDAVNDRFATLRKQGYNIPINISQDREIFLGPPGSGEVFLGPPPPPNISKAQRKEFNAAFREARRERKDTFMWEGKRYTADHPVDREAAKKATDELVRSQKQAGGSMLVPPEMEAPVDTYPNIPPEEMAEVEASQLPDEEMESDYVDFVMNEALDGEEQSYLMTALEADPQLSMIFDKVVDTASEFSGAGAVDGPGDGVSDSIPARLSAGEFVVTKKATDQIGADNLQTMMDEAERAYDGGLMGTDKAKGENINEAMLFSNQMPSLNVRQR